MRKLVHPEVLKALQEHGGEVSFRSRRILDDAFLDPDIFNDEAAQRAFINLMGRERALSLMRAHRLMAVRGNVSQVGFEEVGSLGGRWRSFRSILSFTKEQVEDGPLRIVRTGHQRDLYVDPVAVRKILRSIRDAAYRSREVGLPFNILRSVQADFVTGEIRITNGGESDALNLNVGVLPDIRLPSGQQLLATKALYAPDIGVRLMGEPGLAIVAKELVRMLNDTEAKEGVLEGWSYRRAIDAMIHAYGEVDATPFIINVMEQLEEELKDEGVINKGRRHLILATYYDYLLSHVERRLQWLANIVPEMPAEGTTNALVRSLFLALDSDAVPDEIRNRPVALKIYRSARASLKEILRDKEMVQGVKGVINEYLVRYDEDGFIWFAGQVLPLVALFGSKEAFVDDALFLAKEFDPRLDYDWSFYPSMVRWVRNVVDPTWDDPDGGERMPLNGGGEPIPALDGFLDPSKGPQTFSRALPCIQGGLIAASGRALKLSAG